MAEEENIVKIEKKDSGKGLIIVLIILIVVLILGFAGGGYYITQVNMGGGNQSMMADSSSDNTAQGRASVGSDAESFNFELNDLILNITTSNGREKLMKLSFTLKSIEPKIDKLIAKNKSEIIDLVISLISSRNAEELLTVGGKELLKEEMLQEINNILNRSIGANGDFQINSIKNIFFTSFVIK